MPYLFNTPDEIETMLEAIGAESIDELFSNIPQEYHLNRPLDLPPAVSEIELTQQMEGLAAANQHAAEKVCFLGGGAYDHFIPAVIDEIAGRGEFYTSYTPYQPEVSQGNLQAMFEYQTLICNLTGLDVSNASLYDGGSAFTEAAMMCISTSKQKGNIVVPDSVHPEYRQILTTYLANLETELITVPTAEGVIDLEKMEAAIGPETAGVLVQSPNFFGNIEPLETLAEMAHKQGALLASSFDPISLGLLKRPGDLGVDIAIAEGQSLGSPMAYGGPYLGIMACRDKFVRRMPGRIAGETTDRRGRRCWVLTLQTREQHIRRAKATSNICTNQGLLALRASLYLACLGPKGLQETAMLCTQKAHYAAEKIIENDRFEQAFDAPFFKEFVIRDKQAEVDSLLADAEKQGFFAGIALGRWYPELSDCFLVSVTERRSREEIDRLAASLSHSLPTAEKIHA